MCYYIAISIYIERVLNLSPSIQQLIGVIAAGDDSISNRLILKLDGRFELLPYETTEDALAFDKLKYVTRWETFDSGNEYVGIDASQDTALISSIMDWANTAWSRYQSTGKTKILNPYI